MSTFSNEPIPDVQQQYDDWEPQAEFAPPIPAGVYNFYLAQVRSEREINTQKGLRYMAQVDVRVLGGEHDDRAVTYQRVSNAEFERPRGSGKFTSTLMDLAKTAGQQPPKSNQEASELLNSMVQRGTGVSFKAQVDWRGFCIPCYEKALKRLTGAYDVAEAKSTADKDQYKEANAAGSKAKSMRNFPEDGNGNRKDTLICPDCGNEVRANVEIRRFVLED